MIENQRSLAAKAAILLLCCAAGTCRQEQPSRTAALHNRGAVRRTLPRFSDAPEWAPCTTTMRPAQFMAQTVCASHIPNEPVSVPDEDCDDMIGNREETVRVLVSVPRCTDTAVRRLKVLAAERPSPKVLSDLSAAYALRAERGSHPSDLLRSLDSAETALASSPKLAEAQFNRALALEQLGLPNEAMEQWDRLRRGAPSGWRTEADQHWKILTQRATMTAASQWPKNQQRIEDLVDKDDHQALANLIDPFRGAAHRYVEEEVLPAWADAAAHGDAAAARRQLAIASAIAARIATVGDRYLPDAVARIEEVERSGDHAMRDRLRRGLAAYGSARRSEQTAGPEMAAAAFADARQLLASVSHPVAYSAAMGQAIALSFSNQFEKAMALLAPVEEHARTRNYLYVLGRARSNQAYLYTYQSRLIEALERYDAAIETFTQIGDRENVANAHTRKIGILRTLGDTEQAWTEAFLASRDQARFVETPSRHEFLGETAEAATALGCPRIALLYQSAAVRLFQERLAETPATDEGHVRALRRNLGIALRGMAAIRLRLHEYQRADQDLAQAFGYTTEGVNDDVPGARQALLARMKGVEGDAALQKGDANHAIRAFGEGFALAAATPFRTFRAEMLIGRAEAHRRAGHRDTAEADLRAAIEELRAEEDGLLQRRQRGRNEEFWSAYFSRSQETYQRLIRQLAEDGRKREALEFAERARAYEPLYLVLQLDTLATRAFRRWTHDGRSLTVAQLQEKLPAGTFLLEYSVLDDRTYVWIVSRKSLEMLTLPVRRDSIDRWNETLRASAQAQNTEAFEEALYETHRALLSGPLEVIESIAPQSNARLVFSPDGPMHGLPLAALRPNATSHYLVEDHRLSVAASGTLYVYSLFRDSELAREGERSALLIGNPTFTPSAVTHGLPDLPRGINEVRRIAPLYAPAVHVLVDKDATARRFFELAPGAAVVHVVAHVIARPDMPFRSFMLLAPSHDHLGVVDAQELLTRLPAGHTRLFVLSACSSAGGVPIGPEGLAPLVRPLITAGIPAVVGSLWNVGDAPSEELLVAFHKHYRNGLDADDALRLAQIEMRNHGSAGLNSVLAWAPYQIVGYASSPFRPN
jgi:CHAT domain-containing protein